MDAVARRTHAMLNQIIVGSVFMVDVKMRARLENKANRYSHHHCFPNSKPGKMIAILVENAHASTTLTRVQYDLSNHFLDMSMMSRGLSTFDLLSNPLNKWMKRPVGFVSGHDDAIVDGLPGTEFDSVRFPVFGQQFSIVFSSFRFCHLVHQVVSYFLEYSSGNPSIPE